MTTKNKKQIMVHAYKYNGWLYRVMESPYILYENNYVICLYFPTGQVNSIKSEENSNRNFHFKNHHHRVWFFFKDLWFNIIVNYYENQHSFYVNLASPYLIEEGAIKYIDFDLDFRIQSDNSWKLIDKFEYEENSKKYNYPKEIMQKINETTLDIIRLIKSGWFTELYNEKQNEDLLKLIEIMFPEENIQNELIEKNKNFPFKKQNKNHKKKFNYKKNLSNKRKPFRKNNFKDN